MAVALPLRSRPAVGAVSPTGLVSDEVEELYDYDVLRQLSEPSMFIVRVSAPTVVLGGSQPRSVLQSAEGLGIRRRRGGGGAVLLQPDDVWVDWWIPRDDERWHVDVHECSYLVGQWWQQALSSVSCDTEMHRGAVIDDPATRVACFTGRGPGELFRHDRKVVGVTQWRVREGMFLSTVLHEAPSTALAAALLPGSTALVDALDHHTLTSLDIDGDQVLLHLRAASQPVTVRQLYLLA